MKKKNAYGNQVAGASRRRFMRQSSMVAAGSAFAGMAPTIASSPLLRSPTPLTNSPIASNPLGFNGQRKDPVTGGYHLGNGYRMYNPRIMRFNAADNMSPFGKGGINSYAYCLGDPINKSDPSGHFAIMSLIIGAIVGAVAGAAVSAAAEGIRAAVTGTKFDAKQIGIGAALGFLSGGFGAAAVGAKTSVKVGLAVADAVVSGVADFGINYGINKGSGKSNKEAARSAGITAGIGAVVGLATFGVGQGVGKAGKFLSNNNIKNMMQSGMSGRGAAEAGRWMANNSLLMSNITNMPQETQLMILGMLDERSLKNMFNTNTHFESLIQGNRLLNAKSQRGMYLSEMDEVEKHLSNFGNNPTMGNRLIAQNYLNVGVDIEAHYYNTYAISSFQAFPPNRADSSSIFYIRSAPPIEIGFSWYQYYKYNPDKIFL
ncbi:RHS repeat-associated core domain-containing protein [Photobacterium minamisatsumaniensis]|uniref:RHS repeat-associated core domain-containing protein n=1 Tax=Photobacterium minamisatsumaniensis TaxID=2910233 RepID=UPI003D126A50